MRREHRRVRVARRSAAAATWRVRCVGKAGCRRAAGGLIRVRHPPAQAPAQGQRSTIGGEREVR